MVASPLGKNAFFERSVRLFCLFFKKKNGPPPPASLVRHLVGPSDPPPDYKLFYFDQPGESFSASSTFEALKCG